MGVRPGSGPSRSFDGGGGTAIPTVTILCFPSGGSLSTGVSDGRRKMSETE